MKQRILSILVLFSMLTGLFPTMLLPIQATANSGSFGDNLVWTFDSATGLLSISGAGGMTEDASFTAPWAKHSADIKTVMIDEGVTNIGNSAFEGCSSLTSVTIPSSVTGIGDYAFMGCENLKSVTIPDGVMSIGYFTFVDCINLTSVTIPNSVTDICEYAFYNCKSLPNVTIPEGVVNIWDSAFAYCGSLTNVMLPASVSTFGLDVFACCENLGSIAVAEGNANYSNDAAGVLFNKDKTTLICFPCGFEGEYSIPSGVTRIGDSAFAYCSGLTNVVIPNSVKSIGNDAFSDCGGLSGVSVPSSVTSIGNYAFYNCSDIASITIPESVASIGSYTFSNCSNLQAIAILNKTCTIADEIGTLGTASNTVIYGYPGSTAETYAENNNYRFTELSDTLCEDGTHCHIDGICLLCDHRQILSGNCGTDAQWCLDVAEGNLTVSGNGAMADYSATSVPWEDYRLWIKTISINEGITRIENSTFSWHENLKSITIPSSVTSIGGRAFFGCGNLEGIWVKEGNSVYSNDSAGVLFNKTKTILILCPNALMGEYCIPDSVTTIDYCAFECCSGLTSILIPDSVTSFGTNAFADCSNLKSIRVAEGNTMFCSDAAGVLFDKDKTGLICCPNGFSGHYTIPDSVMSIGDNAFSGCGSLTAVTMSNNITSIGDSAFAFCSELTSITIPAGVISIGYAAFSWCSRLSHVHFLGDRPTISNEAFDTCSSELILCYIEGNRDWDNCPINCAVWNYARSTDCVRLSYTCIDCGEVYSYTSEDAHAWKVVEENYIVSNCTEAGKINYRCTVCGVEKNESVPALGHQQGTLLSETFMYWEYTCLRCSKSFLVEKDERYRAMQLQGVEVILSKDNGYEWMISENDATVSSTALISSNQYEDSSFSETTLTLTSQQTFVLNFFYMVSSEEIFDNMTVLLDGNVIIDAISGNINGEYRSQELSAGTHALTLQYAKDSSASDGTDTGYIYNIVAETVECTHPGLKLVPAIQPSCTEPGYIAYWHCNICMKCFADIDASVEISVEDLLTPAVDHSYASEITTAPSCMASGVRTYSCERCGDSYTEIITAKGHSYTTKITTAPTCSEDGIKAFICTDCSDTYTEAISATGHTVVIDTAVAATCTNSGLTEGKHCAVCNEVLVARETVAALEHDYSYVSNGDGMHTVSCSRCDSTFTENHSFTNGTCFCGDAEIIVDESIKIYHTLDLASDISISFVVPMSALSNYDSFYLEYALLEYEGNTLMGTSTVQIDPVVNGNYYYFTLTGITAVRMGDMVDAVLHMTKGTQAYISKTDSYSVATYAYAMLNSTTDTKMLTLCADLLRYGAEAQSFKKYRTDALVDAAMTDKHRTYLSDTAALSFTATDSFLGDLASPTIPWVGKTLDLGSKVGMKFVFNAKNYSGNVENLSMKVTYQGSNGETKTVTLTGAEAYNAANSYHSFTFYGLLASELRTVVNVAIYEGETQLSQTLRYSAESYASKTGGTALESLTRALFAYSDSAKAFFAK